VDDMIVKFKKRKSCLGFKKVVWDIKEVQVEANPAKYLFGVKFEKLLRFVVNNWRIEVNPNKVKTIQSMHAARKQEDF